MNPYADFLGTKNPFEAIRSTPTELSAAIASLGAKGIDASLAPGKWTVREIVCHLADTEIVFAFRLRQVLAENNHVIQVMDQERWSAPYSGYELVAALQVFSSVRNWNLQLLASVKPEDFARPATHPERGALTFRTLVETMAGHDINHLGQIRKIAAKGD